MASPFPDGFIFCGGRWPGAYGFCVAGRLPSFGAGGVSAGKRQKGWFYDRAAEGRDWFAAVPGADWQEVARIVLHIDSEREPERARTAYQSHLARAKWVTEQGRLLRGTGSK